MLATFAFDVCHDVYRAAREAIDMKIPTLNAESSGKYQWRPDRMPRLAEYVCDFARAGERALGFNSVEGRNKGRQAESRPTWRATSPRDNTESILTKPKARSRQPTWFQTEFCLMCPPAE